MDSFHEGWSSVAENTATAFGVLGAHQTSSAYISTISSEVEQLKEDLKQFDNSTQASKILGGYAAEYWHAGIFNIDAAVRNSSGHASVLDGSNRLDLGGADIILSTGEKYGSKFFATAGKSIAEHAKTIYERYREYSGNTSKNGGHPIDFDEYCRRNGFDSANRDMTLYSGQIRLIPTDQMKEAIDLLKNAIRTEQSRRPDQVPRYQEVLDLLTDRLKSSDGTESVPLSKADATKLAEIAKHSNDKELNQFLESHGLTLDQLVSNEYILTQALKAGLNAAVIAMVIRVAPEIIKVIENLIRGGVLSIEDFKSIGGSALRGGGESFLSGGISATITTACLAGKFGETLQDIIQGSIAPKLVGAITVLVLNSIRYSVSFAMGNKTRGELVDNIMRDATISAFSLGVGAGLQAIAPELPVFAYMLGSFIGSIIGGIAYNIGHSMFLSFCVESGFTLFGLVDQDYALPDEVAREIGLSVFNYEKFDYAQFKYSDFAYSSFEYSRFKYAPINIHFLRRGVIGVNQVGYVS